MTSADLLLEARINRVRLLLALLLLALSGLSRWLKGPEHQDVFALEAGVAAVALALALGIARLCRQGAGSWLRWMAVTLDFALITAILAIHAWSGRVFILGTTEFYHALLDTAFLLVFVENSLNALRLNLPLAVYCAALGGLLTLAMGLYSSYRLGIPGTLVDSVMRLAFVVATALIPLAKGGEKQ